MGATLVVCVALLGDVLLAGVGCKMRILHLRDERYHDQIGSGSRSIGCNIVI